MFALNQGLDENVTNSWDFANNFQLKNSFSELALKLMITAVDMARRLNVPAIVGIFVNKKLQKFANLIGMHVKFLSLNHFSLLCKIVMCRRSKKSTINNGCMKTMNTYSKIHLKPLAL